MLSRKTTRRRRGGRSTDARTFVCNSLAAKAQSVAEIEAKLRAREHGPDEAASAIAEATRLGYLNDAELAGQLARGLCGRGYGRRRAARTLRQRRLPEALADAYGGADEDALALSALGARMVDDETSRRRAAAFLVRRGFTPAAAWRAVEQARAP